METRNGFLDSEIPATAPKISCGGVANEQIAAARDIFLETLRIPGLLCTPLISAERLTGNTQYKRAPLFGSKVFGASHKPIQKGAPFMTNSKYIGMDVHKEKIGRAHV